MEKSQTSVFYFAENQQNVQNCDVIIVYTIYVRLQTSQSKG